PGADGAAPGQIDRDAQLYHLVVGGSHASVGRPVAGRHGEGLREGGGIGRAASAAWRRRASAVLEANQAAGRRAPPAVSSERARPADPRFSSSATPGGVAARYVS